MQEERGGQIAGGLSFRCRISGEVRASGPAANHAAKPAQVSARAKACAHLSAGPVSAFHAVPVSTPSHPRTLICRRDG